jgi:hypothetical protein
MVTYPVSSTSYGASTENASAGGASLPTTLPVMLTDPTPGRQAKGGATVEGGVKVKVRRSWPNDGRWTVALATYGP